MSYSSQEVCQAVGMTYRELDYIYRGGILRPSVREATRSGEKHRWSLVDIWILRAICRLRRAGIELDTAKLAASAIREADVDHYWLYIAAVVEHSTSRGRGHALSESVAGTCAFDEAAEITEQFGVVVFVDLEAVCRGGVRLEGVAS